MPETLREKLTTVIPTHERPEKLHGRVLPCIRELDCRILVVDSSAKPDAACEAAADIDYVHCPGQELAHKMNRPILERVDTPYIMLNADDTATSPDAVRRCLEFLEGEPSYSSAAGLHFQCGHGGGELACPQYERHVIPVDAERPGDRLLQNFALFYSSYYCVQRSGVWKELVSRIPAVVRNYYLFETYVVLMAAVHGKLAKLPLAFALMEAGPSINEDDRRYHSSPFKLATEARYAEEVRAARQAVVDYLAETGNLAAEEAAPYVDGALAMYWLQDKPVRTCADKLRTEWQRLLDKTVGKAAARRAKAERVAQRARRAETMLAQALDYVGEDGRRELDAMHALTRQTA